MPVQPSASRYPRRRACPFSLPSSAGVPPSQLDKCADQPIDNLAQLAIFQFEESHSFSCGGIVSDLFMMWRTSSFVFGSVVVLPMHSMSLRNVMMMENRPATVSSLARCSSILGLSVRALQLCDGRRLAVRHAPV